MPNSIALADKFLAALDAVYKQESKTAILDTADERIRWNGAQSVEIFKISMDGFGDYSRNSGYPVGSVTSTWEQLQLAIDRGIELSVDAMDDDETLNMAFASVVGEFARTQMAPELDAYRFSKYASTVGIESITAADITVGTTDVPGNIDTLSSQMSDKEVPVEGRILFVSELAYAGLKARITRYLANERDVNREVEVYNGMRVIRVPSIRFNNTITLNSGSGTYGYSVTTGGYAINAMIVHPSAVVQVVKHNPIKIFSPAVNQTMDSWKFQVRCYHDCFVYDNKVSGIGVWLAATAN